MDVLGAGCLLVAALGGVVALLWPSNRTGWMLVLGGWWGGVIHLMVRFEVLDLSLREVVTYSRAELPAWLRVAGAWAGPSGSLLAWTAMCLTAVVVAAIVSVTDEAPKCRERLIRIAGASSLLGVVVIVGSANPFLLDSTVPINGLGLSPVLEHPAMLIHPPLLYLAQAATVYAAVRTWRSPSTRPIAVAAALFALATLIGAWWAHDELGWGGWWAWDPVENTALAPLAALVAALHAAKSTPGTSAEAMREGGSKTAMRRWSLVAAGLVLVGVAVTRSGLAESVHAFADGIAAGLTIGAVGLAMLGTAIAGYLRDLSNTNGSWWQPVRTVSRLVGGIAAWVILVVLAGELAAMWLGSRARPAALDGGILGQLLIPAGVAVLGGLVMYGWRSPRRLASMLAHLGVVLFGVGVIASFADWNEGAVIDVDGARGIRGELVEIGQPQVTETRTDLRRVTVPVNVSTMTYEPGIDRYPDLGRSRSRPDRRSDWRGETEVVVTYVDSERVRVEIRRHSGLGQVWLGGLMVVAGLSATALGRHAGQGRSRLRRRFSSSRESREELGGSSLPPVPSGVSREAADGVGGSEGVGGGGGSFGEAAPES